VNALVNHFEYDVFYGNRNYLNLDGDGITTKDDNKSPFDLERMIPNANMANQSMFFRKRIFQHGNFLDTSFHHCMDHEFFWRLIFKGYRFIFVPEIKACYRLHADCKGRQPDNNYMTDTIAICRSVYNNNDLPYSVRRQAWSFLRSACLNNYGQLKLTEFRQSLYDLIDLGGIIRIDVELVIKYIISFVGKTQLSNIRKLKPFVK
jgi:GT2 family glycosyltransferase